MVDYENYLKEKMNNKLRFIFYFTVLIPFSFIAQFNAINYNKYPYINQSLTI